MILNEVILALSWKQSSSCSKISPTQHYKMMFKSITVSETVKYTLFFCFIVKKMFIEKSWKCLFGNFLLLTSSPYKLCTFPNQPIFHSVSEPFLSSVPFHSSPSCVPLLCVSSSTVRHLQFKIICDFNLSFSLKSLCSHLSSRSSKLMYMSLKKILLKQKVNMHFLLKTPQKLTDSQEYLSAYSSLGKKKCFRIKQKLENT